MAGSSKGKKIKTSRRNREANQKIFLAALSRCGNLTEAARLSNLERSIHYQWLKEDPTYEERFREAEAKAIEFLENKAWELASNGNVTMLIFMLKKLKPEYRDNYHLHIDGKVQHKHSGSIDVSNQLTTEERIRRLGALLDAARIRRDGSSVIDVVGREQPPRICETSVE